MVTVARYSRKEKAYWDAFNAEAKNGHFLFARDYIEYHADRFTDHSLLIRDEKGNLIALFPANVKEDVVSSHGGLTFGGVVSDQSMRTELMLEIFEALIRHYQQESVKRIFYKAVPHIYHSLPAEEDLYALFRNNARLVRRDVSTSIRRSCGIEMSSRRKRGVRKAAKSSLSVKRSHDFTQYMEVVKGVLNSKYDADPVHSCEEIELLAGRFPENIKLFAAHNEQNEMQAGVIIYESRNVAHAQYIASSEEGKKNGALDLIFDYLLTKEYESKEYFDFGISNEQGGRYLNVGLINQKEEFGARAVVYDAYELDIR